VGFAVVTRFIKDSSQERLASSEIGVRRRASSEFGDKRSPSSKMKGDFVLTKPCSQVRLASTENGGQIDRPQQRLESREIDSNRAWSQERSPSPEIRVKRGFPQQRLRSREINFTREWNQK
jgi:hypothetical protein